MRKTLAPRASRYRRGPAAAHARPLLVQRSAPPVPTDPGSPFPGSRPSWPPSLCPNPHRRDSPEQARYRCRQFQRLLPHRDPAERSCPDRRKTHLHLTDTPKLAPLPSARSGTGIEGNRSCAWTPPASRLNRWASSETSRRASSPEKVWCRWADRPGSRRWRGSGWRSSDG